MNNASEEADSPSRNSLISTVISNYIWSHNQEFLPGFSYRRLESKKRNVNEISPMRRVLIFR